MLPTKGSQVIAREVVKFLQSEEIRDRKILVHSFSVGGYQYSEILQQMLASQSESKEITGRIIGQIYDSPVDLNEVPIGISKVNPSIISPVQFSPPKKIGLKWDSNQWPPGFDGFESCLVYPISHWSNSHPLIFCPNNLILSSTQCHRRTL